MAFLNFFGKQYESASNFLDDLEMAFLVSGRDEEEVKLRAFPLVLKDSAKNWFQNLEPGRKTNWETLKETFLSKYGGHRISSLHQATSRTYLTYESQFLRLWAEWEASLAEGERAPNFLKKEKFLAGLFPDLQEKVKGKFPETFEEALQIARVKDRKLEYQAHTSRVEHPQGPTMADERLPPAPTTTPEDPHLKLLQRVTNQLDNLSINMVQGVRQQQPQPNNKRMPNGPRRQPQRRDYFCYNCGEEGHGMYFCPHPRNFNAQAGRGRQQVTPPRARPPPQPQILQNPQMVAQPQVLQRSVSPQPVAEIPPLPNNNEHLRLVFEQLRVHALYAKPSKCNFFQTKIHYLGHVISYSGIKLDTDKVAAILRWPHLNTVKELQIFLGMARFYRQYIWDYAKIVIPMTDHLKAKGKTFSWEEAQRHSFERLKVAVATAPILAIIDALKSFVVETDASDKAIGVILLQEGRPIAFEIKKLDKDQQNYSVYERELYAIVHALRKWSHYFYGAEFEVVSYNIARGDIML
ncbi:hypothetical protein L7F22_025492 [Adiantum nelumboides]|nr:hypothetical protein [Adiantum nelumboides]